MHNEKDYRILSQYVYQVDEKAKDYDPNLKVGTIIKDKDFHYKTLNIDDTSNGMQAMAVAPFINGKVDTSEIVIAYAGTNPGDSLDRWTDFWTVIGGSKELDTSKPFETATPIDGQVITAEKFAEGVKNDYPDAVNNSKLVRKDIFFNVLQN